MIRLPPNRAEMAACGG